MELAQFQLSLFPWRPQVDMRFMPKPLRENRNPDQLVRSAIAYCEWRAGNSWRRLSDGVQRRDSERWDYLEAARLMREASWRAIQAELAAQPPLPSPKLPPQTATDPALLELSRGELVSRLIGRRPELQHRLVKFFTRAKLARMVTEAGQEKRAS